MKSWLVWMLSLAVASAAWAQEAKKEAPEAAKSTSRFYFAKVTDRNGQEECRVLSDEEFKSLQEEIGVEGRCFSRALQAAEAEWRKGEDTKKKTFPRSAVKQKKLDVLQTYTDRAIADKKLESYQKRLSNEADRNKTRQPTGKTRTREQQADDMRKEADRAALDDQARSIFEGKLAEMIAAAKKPAEAAPAPGAK